MVRLTAGRGIVLRRTRQIAAALLALLMAGCAGPFERMPVPTGLAEERASLVHIEGGRFWGDEQPKDIRAEMARRLPNLGELGRSADVANGRKQIQALALSGGGPDGAFGAGVLAGWTKRGTRPEFEHVTGVSAGAIIAPFAYLGPEYDSKLEEIWTAYGTTDLVTPQFVVGLLGGDALIDTTPLKNLIAKYVDRQFLKEVAREYRRGRVLMIGTTNLDAKRPVVWNMGEIAIHDSQEAVELFRDVILASASIPGLFPPVNIKVKVDGKIYDEMHVDGGVTRQIFITPVNLPLSAFDALYSKPPERKLYLVQNSKMNAEYAPVKQTTFEIASSSILTLLQSQHRGDIYRIYRMARDSKAEFNTISVPAEFHYDAKEKFDLGYQRALFAEGFRLGQVGAWSRKPADAPDGQKPRAPDALPAPPEDPGDGGAPQGPNKPAAPMASNRLSAL
ncbi:MAG: patatin-like phospholipase family protein [Hyphomicrobium sp.]|nr:patatin-like phospholipase family protein [Hyphomicrobium sp.]